QRLEQCRYIAAPPLGIEDQQKHGFVGWQPTEFTDPALFQDDPQVQAMISAAANTMSSKTVLQDYRTGRNVDPNAFDVLKNDTEGVYSFPLSRLNGRRWGIRERIFETAANYPDNLTIKTNCLVTRILFDGNSATGVEYLEAPYLYRASSLAKQSGPE